MVCCVVGLLGGNWGVFGFYGIVGCGGWELWGFCVILLWMVGVGKVVGLGGGGLDLVFVCLCVFWDCFLWLSGEVLVGGGVFSGGWVGVWWGWGVCCGCWGGGVFEGVWRGG